MAKDTRVTFDPPSQGQTKPTNKVRHNRVTERQISYEDAENCVNEMSESFPALSTRAQRLMRQVSGSFNNRTMKVALILSVILNLVLGIPFGIFFGFWMSQKNDASFSTSSASSTSSVDSLKRLVAEKSFTLRESCFPCSDSDLDTDSRVKIKSKNSICCTEDKVLHVEGSPYFCLAADVFKRRCMDQHASVPCKNVNENSRRQNDDSEAAAHLMLNVEETKARAKAALLKAQNVLPLTWIPRDPEHRTFVGKDVEYSNGHIIIHRSGKYHIYSHMTLSTNENRFSDNEGEKIIVHSVTWKSRGPPKTLLFAQITLKENEVKSTNIEGSFELQQGDIISVYLSHPSFLKNIDTGNVFGLFML